MSIAFGTDGLRGEALTDISVGLAASLAKAVIEVFESKELIVGSDTRESGPQLLQGLAAGAIAAGAKIENMGVCPTPAVAHRSQLSDLPAVVVSASHLSLIHI